MTDALERSLGKDGGAADVLATGTATQHQLALLFKRNKNTIAREMVGLAPVGKRRGDSVYSISEAAAALVRPSYEIEDYIRHLNPADMPSLLGKEFWNGQLARQKFEEANGRLWDTETVLEALALAFQEIRMVFLLMVDKVEAETSLTVRQREIVKRHADDGVNAAREALVEKFKDYPTPVDNVSGPAPVAEEL